MVGHKLPTFPTPFVGRTAEIAELSHLLDDPDCRLLTLVGPGGIGKTRLAIEVARCKLGDFADGVYFVPLQPLESADHIVTALLDALPLHLIDDAEPRSLLLDYLRKKHVLLLLDNFEHLLDGVDVLTDILNAAAQIKLLVTSRERLNLRAEQVWPLQGLDVPEEVLGSSQRCGAIRRVCPAGAARFLAKGTHRRGRGYLPVGCWDAARIGVGCLLGACYLL